VKNFVFDEEEQMNAEVLEKLKKVQDRNTFLQVLLTYLYEKAVKEEGNIASFNVTDGEKHKIDTIIKEVCEKEKKNEVVTIIRTCRSFIVPVFFFIRLIYFKRIMKILFNVRYLMNKKIESCK